jgi:hypothetical protein
MTTIRINRKLPGASKTTTEGTPLDWLGSGWACQLSLALARRRSQKSALARLATECQATRLGASWLYRSEEAVQSAEQTH